VSERPQPYEAVTSRVSAATGAHELTGDDPDARVARIRALAGELGE
jgi:hypothetical protein